MMNLISKNKVQKNFILSVSDYNNDCNRSVSTEEYTHTHTFTDHIYVYVCMCGYIYTYMYVWSLNIFSDAIQ